MDEHFITNKNNPKLHGFNLFFRKDQVKKKPDVKTPG